MQLIDEEDFEEIDEVQPKQSEFFRSVTPSTKNAKLQTKFLKKAKPNKVIEDDRKVGENQSAIYGIKRRNGKITKEIGPDTIEQWTETAAFFVRIIFFLANIEALMFAVNVFDG